MINQGESVPLVGKEIGLSTFGTTLNIVKAILGIGTFIMPAATEEGGIGMMVATMMGVGLMSLYTFVLIYRAAVLVGTHEVTYPEIARTAFGKVGEALAVLALSLMTLGVCAVFLLFVAQELTGLLKGRFTRQECVLLATPGLILMSWLRSYRILAPFSVIGLVSLFSAIVVVLVDAKRRASFVPLSEYKYFDLGGMYGTVGKVAFMFMAHSIYPAVSYGMKQPNRTLFASFCSVLIVMGINLPFGVVVYMLYRENTVGNVLDDLSDGWVKTMVSIAVCVNVYFTITPYLFPFCATLEERYLRLHVKSTVYEFSRNVLRLCVLGVIVAVCLVVKTFDTMSTISGCLGSNVVATLLPCSCYLKIKYDTVWKENGVSERKDKWDIIACTATLVAGTVILLLPIIPW